MSQAKIASPWRGPKEQQGDREGKMEAVLRAAAQTFTEKGYYATSMDDVAARLKVTKPTLYHYFKNKEEILYQCVRLGLSVLQASVNEIVGAEGPAIDKLRAAILKYAEATFTDFGAWAVRAGEEPLSQKRRLELRKVERHIDDCFRQLIAAGIDEGQLVPCDPRMVISAIAGTLNWITRWYRPNGELKPAQIAEQVYAIVIDGLRVRELSIAASSPARKARAKAASAT